MDEQQSLIGLEDDRTIFRRPKDRENPYVMVAKEAVFDRRVSIAARLLLTAMLCQPDDWDFNVRHLADVLGTSRMSVARWMQELLDTGYVVRDQSRRRGRFGRARYLVFERPTVSQSTVSQNTAHGGTVHGGTGHGETGHTEYSSPDTEYGEREDPPPAAAPESKDPAPGPDGSPPQVPDLSTDDACREATEAIGFEHLRARGRPPGWSTKDEQRLVEIIRQHGRKAVVSAFRRFLERSPPDKAAHWFLQDWESLWQPPRRPKPKGDQRPCACGSVLTFGSGRFARCGCGRAWELDDADVARDVSGELVGA